MAKTAVIHKKRPVSASKVAHVLVEPVEPVPDEPIELQESQEQIAPDELTLNEIPWREHLTVDNVNMIREAEVHAARWQGAENNSPLMLIAKLSALLDEHNSPEGR